MDNWQPIDTAPRDGTRILLWRPNAYFSFDIIVGHWDPDDKSHHPRPYWTNDAEQKFGSTEARKFQPTHWMPLPKAPVEIKPSPAPASHPSNLSAEERRDQAHKKFARH